MKKIFTKIGAVLLAALITVSVISPVVSLADSAPEVGYTYNFDYWGDTQYCPDAYNIGVVLYSKDLGLKDPLRLPQGLTVDGDRIFIVDTGNNRILEFKRTGLTKLELVREISEIKTDKEDYVTTFSSPYDVAIDSEGYIYVADKDNHRIVKLDNKLNLVLEFLRPDHETFTENNVEFLPMKICCDSVGRVYVVSQSFNQGLIKFEADGSYSGLIGASPVSFTLWEQFWKRIATKEQLAKMVSFVPTEYDNLFMDSEGFIYVTTTHLSDEEIDDGKGDPIRRLNMMGGDILIRNGDWWPIGDIYWGEAAGHKGPSKLCDITAMENEIYFALDKNRGRIFAYNDQGKLLFAFGRNGNIEGYFRNPVALDHMDRDLFVLDQTDNSLTIFLPTEYGNLIFDAQDQFKNGEYDASGETWQKVIDINGNYDLAYIGIGRALLRQEKYEEAMEYFKLKYDYENYSRAFVQYRKEKATENIGWIVAVLAVLIIVPLILGKLKRLKFELDHDEYLMRNPIK